jgi:hypothetical protein
LPALSLRDDYIQRGAVPDILKHPTLTFRVVDEDEHGLPRSDCGTVTYPVVDNERNSRDSDRNDGYDCGCAHRATGEKG